MRYLKQLSLLAIIASFLFCLTSFVSPVFADEYGLDTAAKGTGLIQGEGSAPQSLVGKVVSTVLSLVGVLFFLLILFGGIRWMVAAGNESEIDKAKQIIIAAVTGLIIVLAAYAITTFIGNALTK